MQAMPSALVVPQQWWADYAVNGGCSVLPCAHRQPLPGCGPATRGFSAMKISQVTTVIKVNVAWCLFGIAAIISAFR
jgi:hypothetical protein